MRIYQAADGRWILWTGSEKLYFDTQTEALQAMDKLKLAQAIVYRVQQLIETMDNGPDVAQEYFDAGVTFTDEDVAALGVTEAEVVNCLTLLQNFDRFMRGKATNDATEPLNIAIYRTTVNAVRRVNTA